MPRIRESEIEPIEDKAPRIENLSAALSFRVARFVAINERNGAQYFKDQLGVSLSEWRVLGLVAESDGVTTRSIRKTLLMDRGLLSRVVKALRERKLILSQACKTDKRQTQLFLTPSGWGLHRDCIAFTNERNRSMASILEPHEEAEFSRLLDLLIDHNAQLLKKRGLTDD